MPPGVIDKTFVVSLSFPLEIKSVWGAQGGGGGVSLGLPCMTVTVLHFRIKPALGLLPAGPKSHSTNIPSGSWSRRRRFVLCRVVKTLLCRNAQRADPQAPTQELNFVKTTLTLETGTSQMNTAATKETRCCAEDCIIMSSLKRC